MDKSILLVCILIVFFSVFGCISSEPSFIKFSISQSDFPKTLKDLNFSTANFPVFDGSNTTEQLSVLIASKVFDTNYEWYEKWNESDKVNELSIKSTPKDSNNYQREIAYWIKNSVKHSGTHKAYVNLTQGRAEIILQDRFPNEDELKLAKENEVEFVTELFAFDKNTPLYIVTKKNLNKESSVFKIKQWLFSKEGQEIIKESKFVPAKIN
jgi:phosphate transport system substrate-binding protein